MSAIVARRRAEQLVLEMRLKRAPVDVKRVAQHLGVRVADMKLNDASGLLITQPGTTPCIVVNSEEQPVRQRFTIAHELGHFVLRHHFEGSEHVHVDRGHAVSFRNLKSAEGTDPREIEANQFAAVLLMPAALVKIAASKFGPRGLLEHEVDTLAKTFHVSIQAMTIRLNVLGLV